MFQLAVDPQITVRTLHPDDAAELFQLVERNRSRLQLWIHPGALPETLEAARRFTIECFINSLDDPEEDMTSSNDYLQELGHYHLPPNPPVEMGIRVNEKLAGEIMLSRLPETITTAEFGYWISAEWEGQGIITRCVCALMEYAIDFMGIDAFMIGCAVDNLRSRAVPERLGYRLHATIPYGEVVGNQVYDRVIYEIHSTGFYRE